MEMCRVGTRLQCLSWEGTLRDDLRKSMRKQRDWLNLPGDATSGQCRNYSVKPTEDIFAPECPSEKQLNSGKWEGQRESWGCELIACPSLCFPAWERGSSWDPSHSSLGSWGMRARPGVAISGVVSQVSSGSPRPCPAPLTAVEIGGTA